MKRKCHGRVTFKQYNMNQQNLPVSFDSMIPPNHLVRTVNQVIEDMSLQYILSSYKGGGASNYHPRMLLKIILYGYTQKVRSSRQIAKAVRENLNFMWLAGGNQPDFRSINRFRLKMKTAVEAVFQELMTYLVDKGLVKLETYFLDGTKIEANANKYSFVWKDSTAKNREKLRQKVKEMLEDIDRANELEDKIYGDEDLAELGERIVDDSEAFAKLIDKLNTALDGKGKRDKKVQVTRRTVKKFAKDLLPRARRYSEQLKKIGDNRKSMSKTDIDATFMRMKEDHMKNGQLKPGYNVQIGTENQFITGYSVHQYPGDTRCFKEHLEVFRRIHERMPERICADAGYGSEENYVFLRKNEIGNYVKFSMFHQEQKARFRDNPYRRENMPYDEATDTYTCPAGLRLTYLKTQERKSDLGYVSSVRVYECEGCRGCSHRETCIKSTNPDWNRRIEVNHLLDELKAEARSNLTSEVGIELRKRRCIEPEPVFGHVKWAWEFKRFLLRGIEKVTTEWGIICLAHNLRKLWTVSVA
jgi:transposase